jgi:hypothetical protein
VQTVEDEVESNPVVGEQRKEREARERGKGRTAGGVESGRRNRNRPCRTSVGEAAVDGIVSQCQKR